MRPIAAMRPLIDRDVGHSARGTGAVDDETPCENEIEHRASLVWARGRRPDIPPAGTLDRIGERALRLPRASPASAPSSKGGGLRWNAGTLKPAHSQLT